MAGMVPTRRTTTAQPSLPARGAWSSIRKVAAALALLLPVALHAQSTYLIQTVSPSFIPAGANGATLLIGGKLPNFGGGQYQVCFYTGYGSTAAITPPVGSGPTTITVPASTIQSIPTAQFTSGNNYSFPAAIYIVPTGTVCSGAFDSTLTNSFPELISEPLLGAPTAPLNVPQTNSATSVQAPPYNIVLTGRSFTAATFVTFGSFGNLTPKLLSSTALSIAVPAAFASSPSGTTAALSACNASSVGNFCGTGAAVTLTVSPLAPSVGSLTVTPTPVSTTGTTVLTAQFKKNPASTGIPEPGVPTGTVTFTAGSNTISRALLTLDNTATFVPQTTSTQIATTATPVITPAAGTYATAQTVTITDGTPGASIVYTTDGTTPTAASTSYTGPFVISTTQTITALALASGSFPSAPAASAYTIFVPTPTSVGFIAQPTTAATNTVIAPPITVAIQDQNGNTITSSTAPVTIAIANNAGANGVLSGTKTVNAVNGIATFSDLSIDIIANGYTLLATSPTLTSATSTAFNITPYPITVQLFDPLIGVTSTLPGTFTLTHPAPSPNGVTVSLASSATGNVTVSPATVNVPAGGTTGNFTYTGVAPGPATITASAPNYLAGSGTVTATNSLVSLGTIQPVAPGQTISLALSIATNAPAGGVTINFTSSNPAVATITSSVFIPAGQRTAAANPQIVGVTIGSTTINATAQGYAPDTRTVNVTVTSSFNPTSINIPHTTLSSTTLNISAPAQTGGLTFTLSSDDPTKATVPSSVTIPAGQTSVIVPVTGIADGSTIIRADSPGVLEATLNVTVNGAAQFYYGNQITGVNMQVLNYVYLPTTPTSPITITVTSNGPGVVTISKSPTVVGTTSLTFTNITSAGNIAPIYIQGQSIGSTTITVTATGYTSFSNTFTVYPSGFIFSTGYSSGISTTTFSSPYGLSVYPVILNPSTLTYYSTSTLNPGLGPISVPVTSSNTAVGTISTSPLIFNGGDTVQSTNFVPSTTTPGTTTISVGAPSPSTGFSTCSQSQYTSFTATVTAPQAQFYYGNLITGVNMQTSNYVYLPVAPPNPITVTVSTSNGATIVAISKSGTVIGAGTTLTFPNITAAGNIAQVFIQGQAVGTTTLTLTAPGYTGASNTVTVYPSGFVFSTGYNSGISTTSFSSPTALYIYPAILNPSTLTYYTTGTLSPGVGPISVPVTSSNTAVGTVTSPIIFNAGDSSQPTTFTPSSAGTSTIALGTPTGATGISTSSQYTSFVATVTAPQAQFYYGNQIVGVNQQISNFVYLPVAPPSPVTVTVSTSNGASIIAISKSGTVIGAGTTLTFPNITTAGNIAQVFIQGQTVGTSTLTLTATGYTGASNTITVYPSGFVFSTGYNSGQSTTTFSSPTTLYAYPAILNPGTLTYYGTGTLSPGVGPISVPVTSSNTVVGTISTSPLVFNAGDSNQPTNFQPTSAGTSTISLGAPSPSTGFNTPTQYQSFPFTVTAPQLQFYYGNQITGANMQITNYAYLPVAPPNPVTVTVTSNGPAIALLSKSPTVVGTSSLTFTNVTAAGNQPAIYIQGQAVGSTTLTVSAPGYTNGTITVTVYPSGFTFAGSYNSGLSTTSTSSPTTLTVYPSVLNPGTLTYYTTGLWNPGLGSTSVAVTSSNTAAGTITTSPLIFTGGESYIQTSFKPVATGTTNINIVQPPIATTPSQYTGFTATVQ